MKAGLSQGSIRRWPLAGRLVLVLVLAAGVAAAVKAEDVTPFDVTYPKQRLDAPAFQLQDLEGNDVSLEGYRDRVVLLHFWATFCIPCLEEMPVLESLWQQYGGKGLVILGIAGDRGKTEVVREFTERTGVSFPVVHDPDGQVRKQYSVAALPTTYLVGRDGKISGRAIGTRSWDEPGGRALIETLLATKRTQFP